MKVFSIIGIILSGIIFIISISVMADKGLWQGYGYIGLILGMLGVCYFGIKLCESIRISKSKKEKK